MSSDIYETKEPPVNSRRKSPAVSQRRDEYLRATGGEVVPHHRHRHHHGHHGHHRQSSGWIATLFGLGVVALLGAVAFWWLMNRR